MAEILELELLENYDKPIEIDIDFEGEFVSGSDGQDYKRGYDEGHEKGYAVGKADGYESGYTKGLIDGAKEEQEKTVKITENGTTEILPDENKVLSKVKVDVNVADNFMSNYQLKGERVKYKNAFYGKGWTVDTFKPEFDMKPTEMDQTFENSCIIADLGTIFKERNLLFDTSKNTNFYRTFLQSKFTALPTIDCSGVAGLNNTFFYMLNLHTIEKMIVHRNMTTFYNVFSGCSKLKEIRFEGEIAGSISFSSCSVLSMDSVDSIISCLVDLTGQTAKKVSFHPTVIAKLTDEQYAKIQSKNWTTV